MMLERFLLSNSEIGSVTINSNFAANAFSYRDMHLPMHQAT